MPSHFFDPLLRAHRRAAAVALASGVLGNTDLPAPFLRHCRLVALEFGASPSDAELRTLPLASAYWLGEYRARHGRAGEEMVAVLEARLTAWYDADQGDTATRLAAAASVVQQWLPRGAVVEAACQAEDREVGDPTAGYVPTIRSSEQAVRIGASLVGSVLLRLPTWLGSDVAVLLRKGARPGARGPRPTLARAVALIPVLWTDAHRRGDMRRLPPLLRLWGAAVPLALLASGPPVEAQEADRLHGVRDAVDLASGILRHALGECLTIHTQLEGASHRLSPAAWAARVELG